MAKPKAEKPADPLEAAITELNTKFGAGSVIFLDSAVHQQVDAIPTGSVGLDQVTGVGGIPRGRVTEAYGPEGAGKSTLALGAVVSAQHTGLVAAYIDAEHAVDLEYAKAMGVNTSKLLFSQPDSGEEGLITAHALAASGGVGLIVVDSVAALVPQAEINGEIGDAHVGLQARLMSQSLRMLAPVLSGTNTACIFINQLREKIGGVGYGPSETQPGGRALKFYASLRLDIRRIQTLTASGSDHPVGNKVRVKAVKNKVGPPLRQAEFDIRFGQGIDWAGELADLGVAHALVRKSGAFYTLAGGGPAVQGREAARRRVLEQPELAGALREGIAADYAAGRTELQVLVPHPDGPLTREVPNRAAMAAPDFAPVVGQDG